ncbi:MAG TPA: zf-HC2 domain-containing protein [Steroidobacteraceae bacterium]|nr:zf-HC2 domain-containing protein [Steroidobacteraceae bacterium]
MACAESLRVQAYFDGQVDPASAAGIKQHIDGCAACATLLRELEQTRDAIRQELPVQRAPPALRARIMQALDQEMAGENSRRGGRLPSSWRLRPFWAGAAGGMGIAAAAAAVVIVLLSPSLSGPLLDELVADHVKSLLPSQLIAVVSTDQHTVKPWFAGRADVSPVVADFAPQGYRLLGGRADPLAQQRAAVVVYQHGAHIINVFSWASSRPLVPRTATRNGYRLAFWRAGNLDYCAVSDTSWDELLGLEHLLQDLSARDLPPKAGG